MSYETISEKQKKWDEIGKKLETLADGLGYGIEDGIKFAVQSLMANDFVTYQSCEGDFEGLETHYPWITVGNFLVDDTHFNELSKKITYDEATDSEINIQTEEEKEEYREIRQTLELENKAQSTRLQETLNNFYTGPIPENTLRKLILEEQGWNSVRLQPEGVEDEDTEEIKKEFPPEVIKENLMKYRAEMDRFAKYLKDLYFSQ